MTPDPDDRLSLPIRRRRSFPPFVLWLGLGLIIAMWGDCILDGLLSFVRF